MRACPICGERFGDDVLICPRDNVALSEGTATPADPSFRSAYLGRYDEYEAELIVEILTDAGIRAFTKIRRTDPAFTEYGRFATDLGVVMVDAARIDEARVIIAEQLPRQLEAIAFEMDTLAMEMDQQEGPGGDGNG